MISGGDTPLCCTAQLCAVDYDPAGVPTNNFASLLSVLRLTYPSLTMAMPTLAHGRQVRELYCTMKPERYVIQSSQSTKGVIAPDALGGLSSFS